MDQLFGLQHRSRTDPVIALVAIEEHIADSIHRECFSQVFQRKAAVTQFLELLKSPLTESTLISRIFRLLKWIHK